ncbi:MAG: hypothetical protein KBT10_07900 [Bacteroidales bacterium]|mgnify:CR=1 FL=1|nr:hypothetical protein [Candidatus Sodaliphilus aphodohippi]
MRNNYERYINRSNVIAARLAEKAFIILIAAVVIVVLADTMSIWKDLWFIIVFLVGGVIGFGSVGTNDK